MAKIGTLLCVGVLVVLSLSCLIYFGVKFVNMEEGRGVVEKETKATHKFVSVKKEQNIHINWSGTLSRMVADYINVFLETYIPKLPEDATLGMKDLVKKYGYFIEEYEVVTQDGYILKVFRIQNEEIGKTNKEVAFLMHGLSGASDNFVMAGPKIGLGYVLADAGFDVWLGNVRGSMHSQRHTNLSTADFKYWSFSLDELALIDLPAMIDFVIEESEKDEIFYVGHSQGTTLISMLCSRRTEYNDKIKLAVLLAPAMWISKMYSPILSILIELSEKINDISTYLEDGEIVTSILSTVSRIAQIFCHKGSPTTLSFCVELISYITGPDREQLIASNFPVYVAHSTSGCSSRQLHHFQQIFDTEKFTSYDFGAKHNVLAYGTKTAPVYNLQNFTAPVMIAYGENDWVTVPDDVQKAFNSLPNVAEYYSVPLDNFNHVDFIIAKDAKTLVLDKIVDSMRSFTDSDELH